MKTTTQLLAAVALLLAADAASAARAQQAPNQLTPEQIADGWISLFDGETLYGWQPTSDADWEVEDGEIRVTAGKEGWLMTTGDFADYELHVEFKALATTNSGVFLRTPLEPTDPANDCFELNIAPRDNPFPTGSFVGRRRLATVPKGAQHEIDAWDGAWHAFDVQMQPGWIRIDLDGQQLDTMAMMFRRVDGGLAKNPTRGRIGLQFRDGEVAFRNIRLKPLGLKPMLNGNDLAGWRTDDLREAKFTLQDSSGSLPSAGRAGEGGEAGTSPIHPSLTLPIEGRGPEDVELHVTGGPGELETEAAFGDFVMQLECFVDGDGLNSGVFFRSIPGEFANGYESQINNAVKDGDPTSPVDAGTGAIYRRTVARRVVSKDHQWFAKTIIATGPHIAVWVNGEQVTDWTDDRPPHDNPRNGQRTAAGAISLQAHDPTTNIRFRNLKIAELPAGAN